MSQYFLAASKIDAKVAMFAPQTVLNACEDESDANETRSATDSEPALVMRSGDATDGFRAKLEDEKLKKLQLARKREAALLHKAAADTEKAELRQAEIDHRTRCIMEETLSKKTSSQPAAEVAIPREPAGVPTEEAEKDSDPSSSSGAANMFERLRIEEARHKTHLNAAAPDGIIGLYSALALEKWESDIAAHHTANKEILPFKVAVENDVRKLVQGGKGKEKVNLLQENLRNASKRVENTITELRGGRGTRSQRQACPSTCT